MISIVIPTYNRAHQICEALDSILSQSYEQWECIIVDDLSEDNTYSVLQEYCKRDNRFIYTENQRTKGAQGARNTGIRIARGKWICLFDSDDIMYPQYLEEMLKAVDLDVDVLVCQADIYSTRTGQKVGLLDRINSDEMHIDLLKEKAYIGYDVTLIKRDKLLEIDMLDENCPSMQEWDTHIRLSRIAKYKAVDKPLCEWRVGGDDTITHNSNKHLMGLLYIYLKHRKDFRKYAYRHFLNSMSKLFGQCHNKLALIVRVPELIFFMPLKKFYNFIHGNY